MSVLQAAGKPPNHAHRRLCAPFDRCLAGLPRLAVSKLPVSLLQPLASSPVASAVPSRVKQPRWWCGAKRSSPRPRRPDWAAATCSAPVWHWVLPQQCSPACRHKPTDPCLLSGRWSSCQLRRTCCCWTSPSLALMQTTVRNKVAAASLLSAVPLRVLRDVLMLTKHALQAFCWAAVKHYLRHLMVARPGRPAPWRLLGCACCTALCGCLLHVETWSCQPTMPGWMA